MSFCGDNFHCLSPQAQNLSKTYRYAEKFIKTVGFHIMIPAQPCAHNSIDAVYLHSIYSILISVLAGFYTYLLPFSSVFPPSHSKPWKMMQVKQQFLILLLI